MVALMSCNSSMLLRCVRSGRREEDTRFWIQKNDLKSKPTASLPKPTPTPPPHHCLNLSTGSRERHCVHSQLEVGRLNSCGAKLLPPALHWPVPPNIHCSTRAGCSSEVLPHSRGSAPVQVLPDGVVVHCCSQGDEDVPDGVGKRNDAVTFEEHHSQAIQHAAPHQLLDTISVRLYRERGQY